MECTEWAVHKEENCRKRQGFFSGLKALENESKVLGQLQASYLKLSI